MVKVDAATATWDARKKHWLIRFQIGAEVISRVAPHVAREADDETLRSLVAGTARDEGYDLDPARVTVTR